MWLLVLWPAVSHNTGRKNFTGEDSLVKWRKNRRFFYKRIPTLVYHEVRVLKIYWLKPMDWVYCLITKAFSSCHTVSGTKVAIFLPCKCILKMSTYTKNVQNTSNMDLFFKFQVILDNYHNYWLFLKKIFMMSHSYAYYRLF